MKKSRIFFFALVLALTALLCVWAGAETQGVDTANSDGSLISYQVSKGENGEFSIRLIAGLNSLEYANFGYEVTVTTKDAEGNDVTNTLSGVDNKVYRSIYGGLTAYSIKECFGYEYGALATVTGLALASDDIQIEAHVFVTALSGEVSYGEGAALAYEGTLDGEGYPSLYIRCISHTYDNACDAECNACGYERVAPHSFGTTLTYDENSHWYACSGCEEKKDEAEHSYDSNCDATCACGYERVAPHSFGTTLTYDENSHWYACSGCEEKKDEAEHSYDNDNDATCNDCDYMRELFAYRGTCGADGDNLTWGLTADGHLVISGTGNMANYTSQSDVPWYSYRSSINTVTIGDSVTSIGNYAFYYCKSFTSVNIPDSVTSIGEGAFEVCSSLTSVYITDIASWCNISFGYYDANPLCYAKNLYLDGELVTDLVIPDSVTSIGDDAFHGYESLTSVTIPDSVTSIGEGAFKGCTSLVSVTIGDSVTSIGSHAFFCCYQLVEVINQSSLNITKGSESNGYVAYYALEVHNGESKIVNQNGYLFYTYDGVNYLLGYVGTETALVLPESYNGQNYEIYQYAFSNCTSLTSVTIPDSVTSIGDYAFSGCTSLTSVTIGDSVTSIGDYAFRGCTSLTSVTMGDSVTSVGKSAFGGCTSLASVTIPDSVTIIRESTFYNCTSLTSVTIPDSVTIIRESTFYNCTSLTSVTMGDSVTSIGNEAFRNCTSLTSVTIPGSVTSIGSSAFKGCTSLTYNTYDNAKYLGNTTNPYLYLAEAASTSITSCTIHKDTKFIGDSAFNCCTSLTSVEIPDSVTSIGNYAFNMCESLASVTIPESVTSIGNYAFYGCESLTSVEIPDGVTSIGEEAFIGCESLTSVTVLSKTVVIYYSYGDLFGVFPSSATIYGYAGSTAEAYATEYGIAFVALD